MKKPIRLQSSPAAQYCALALVLLAGALFTPSGFGVDKQWSGATATFNTPANWTTGFVPTNGDNAMITNGGTVTISSSDPAWTVTDVRTGDGSPAQGGGTYSMSGGTVTINGWLRIADGAGTTGTFTMSGGTVTNAGSDLHVAESGTGVLTVSGGVLTKTGGSPFGLATVAAGNGTLNLNGSGVISINGGWFSVGANGRGTLNVSGGNLHVAGGADNTSHDFNISDVTGSFGVLNLSGGTLNTMTLYCGKSGTAQGYAFQTAGSLVMTTGGGADWRIGGSAGTGDANSVGVYNISGGTVTTLNNFQIGAWGSGELNLSGTGVVNANGGFPVVGRNTNSFGVLDISGGAFNANIPGQKLIIGEQGYGILNVRGGNLTNTSTSTAGAILIGGTENTGFTAGVVNLLSGIVNTLSVATGTSGSANVSSTLNFNGATLQANGTAYGFVGPMNAVNVFPGGAVIDTQAFTNGIGAALLSPAGSGVTSIAVNSAGSGYISPPIVRIGGGGGTNATAVATTNSSGGVASIIITSPGTGYTSAPTVTLLGGTNNTGATAATIGTVTIAANTSGGLTKQGSGILLLKNNGNTYTNTTTVSAGTLKVENDADAVLHYTFDQAGGAGNGSWITNSGWGGTGMNGLIIGTGVNIVTGGRYGKALSFDGTGAATSNNIVWINNRVVGTDGTGSWTVGLWIKTSTTGAEYLYQGAGSWASGNTVFYLNNSGAGNKAGFVRFGGGFQVGTAALNDGNWHFVVVTDNAGTKTQYVDGNVDAWAVNAITAASVGTQWWIGGSPDAGDGTAHFNGLIDEVLMYNRALSQTEVQNLMNHNSPTVLANSPISLAGGTTLDLNSFNTTVNSLSGSGAVDTSQTNGTANSTTTLTMNVPAGTSRFQGVLQNSISTLALTKTGSGTQTLGGNSTFSGNVNVSVGSLVISNSNALGVGPKTIFVNNGTAGLDQLHLDGSTGAISLPANLAFQTSNQNAPGAVVNDAGNNVINGPFTMTAGGGATRVTVAGGTLQLAGNITPNTGGRVLALGGVGNGTVSGSILDGGFAPGVLMDGSGVWTLAGPNTYTGLTAVNNGTLALGPGGSIANSAQIIVTNGIFDVSQVTGGFVLSAAQTLGGSGVVTGDVTMASASLLSPGTSPGTLSFLNNVTMSGGASNIFELANATTEGSGVNDEIIIAGDLNLSGANTLTVVQLSTLAASGTYKLIKWNGNLNGSLASLSLTPIPGYSATLVLNGKEIDLTVQVTSRLTWTGDGGANQWDAGSSIDWLNAGSPSIFNNNDIVTFDDTGSTNPVVNISGTVSPGPMAFASTAVDYGLGGSGKISGFGTLSKSNATTLTISNGAPNDFIGGVSIQGGTISIGSIANGGVASPIGASPNLAANLVLNSGKLQYTGGNGSTDRGATIGSGGGTLEVTSPGATLSWGGPIGGSGGLTKSGSGALLVTGTSTYGGNTTVSAGTLQLGDGTANNGVIAGNILNNSAVTVANPSAQTIAGTVNGSGTVTKTGAGALTLAGANGYTGGTTVSGGTLKVGNSAALGSPAGSTLATVTNNSSLDLNGTSISAASLPLVVSGAGTAGNFGALGNSGAALTGAGVNNVTLAADTSAGNDGNRFDIVGTLNGGGNKFTKVGNNDIQLKGAVISVASMTAAGGVLGAEVLLDTPSILAQPAGTFSLFTASGLNWTNSLTMSNSTFSSSSGANAWSGPLAIYTGSNTFSVAGGSLLISNPVSGDGILVKSGANQLTLIGGNTYAGGTVISQGTLQAGNGGPGGDLGPGAVVDNGTLQFNRSDDFTFATDVSGTSGQFVKLNTNTMTLTSTNKYLAGSGGVAQINGGTLQINPTGLLADGGEFWITQNASTGACIINGGTLTASNWIAVGRNGSNALGSLTLNGGSIQKTGGGNIILGSLGGNGTLTVNSGAISNNAQLLLAETAGQGVGTFNLNGGLVQATSVAKFGGKTANATLNGGTLQAVGSSTAFMSGLDQVLVSSGGAILDDNGFVISVGQNLLHDPALGASSDGGLTKNGTGSTILGLGNSFTGNSTVNAGSLVLEDPVLHLTFDSSSGTGAGSTVTNSGTGGSAMNGVLVGNGVSIVNGGRYGKALSFDGNGAGVFSNVVVISNNVVGNINSASSWAVGLWVNTSTPGAEYLFNGTTAYTWSSLETIFYLNSASSTPGTNAGLVRFGGGFLRGTATVNDGTWHFVVVSDNAGTITRYVDGVADAWQVNSWNNSAGTGGMWVIGGSPDTGDGAVHFNGLIDEVYIFNRSLSQTEVQNLMNRNQGGVAPSSIALTSAGATLDLKGLNGAFTSLIGNGKVDTTLPGGTPTLTLNTAAGTTNVFSGVIKNTSGSLGLTKIGAGAFSTTGADTFSGNTFVNGGTLIVDAGGAINTASYCDVGQNGSSTGALVLQGNGAFTTASDFNAGDIGSSAGTVSVSDSSALTANAMFLGSANAAGSTASGTLNQSGGTVTTLFSGDPALVIGGRNGNSSLGVGAYNLTGGALNVNNGGNFWCGGFGTGTLNVSGGTATLSGFVSVGRMTGGVGNLNISSGSVSQSNVGRFAIIGENGTGTLTLSGSGQFSGNGTTLRLGHTATGSGIVNLNGGILQFTNITLGSGSGTFNFNGGTLKAAGSSASFMTGLTTANVQVGGAVVDDNGFSVGIGQVLAHDAGLGATPDGGLVKNGAGTLALGGVNTYNGDTHANAGTLALTGSGSIATSPNLVVAASAVLDATGRSDGTLTLTSGQTLRGWGTVAGTLAVSAGSTLAAGGSVGSITNVGATLLIGGGLDSVEVIDAAGAPGIGYDTLVVNGDLGVLASIGTPFNVKLTSFNGVGAAGAVTNFDNDSSYTWTIASASGSVTNFDPTAFNVDTSSFVNDLAGGYFYAASAGAVSLVFTNNHAPIAGMASYIRPPGVGMKIAITNLLAGYTSDPDGDGRALVSVSASSTNGLNNVSTNDAFIFYSPGTNGNVADAITYTIRDVRSAYRAGDTVRTATGTILIAVSGSVSGQAQSITLSNSTVVVNFAGIPGYAYDEQRSTNLVDWVTLLHTNAPPGGLFQLMDDFSDLGAPPAQAYYRLSYTP